MGSAKSHRSQAAEAMQHNKRMARTLGCLVASMTMGAALLDWVQPKPARLLAATSGTELAGLVRQGTPGTWRSIQLAAQPANRSAARSHFLIRLNGQAEGTALWQKQLAAGDEGVVRIALASDNSNQVTSEQWSKANELVKEIQDTCLIPTGQIHVDDMLAVPSVPPPTPTRRALPSAPPPLRHK